MNRPDIESLIAAAVTAPSSHNTQPWLFRPGPDGLELLADRTRALPVNDPHDRELTISCGCALLNLRVQAAAQGLSATVDRAPDPADDDLLARIRLAPAAAGASDPAGDAMLAPAIARRRTYRKAFDGPDVPAGVVDELVRAVEHEGACLTVVASTQRRHEVAELVAEGDAAQWRDPRWRRELAAWMHPRRRHDGLAMPALAVPVAQLVVRTFDMGNGVGAKDRQLADASPVLAVLCTPQDTVTDWLRAGEALQRALLRGVLHGLQASYLNQPVQVDGLRSRLRTLVGIAGHPQLLLRWGRATAPGPASPRRALHDVLLAPSAG